MWLIVLLSLPAFFRFTYLGYSDFQGDEAPVMLTAADAIAGQDYALFAHGKGPGEVLIPIAFYLPFVRDPQFTKSASYISESRVGSNVLNNNSSQFYLLSTIYNSTYFAFIALLLWVVVKGLHHRRGGYLWPRLAVAALASVLVFPDKWQVGKVNLAVVPFALT